MLFDESCTSSAMKATTRDVLFYHPPSCRWSKTCVWEINPADFIKQKQKKQQKGVRFPLSRWNYTCFSSQLCFCLHAASFYFKYVTHRRLNASEKSSNYSVRVWKSPFECRSPALCGFTRGHFSVFWLISHLKHRVHADTSRPRTPRLPFKSLFEVTVIPQTCFLVGWVQRCSTKHLYHGFNRIQRVKYERKRWSTLIFDCES